MSKTPISFEDNTKKSERKRRTGRGFFTALALCLIAIGGVAASTFSETVHHPTTDTSATTTVPTVRTTEIPAAAPTVASTVTTSTVATTEATTAPTEPPALTALPLNGAILTPFSERPLYNKTMADYRAHTALDLGGEEGQSVMVIAEGTVSATEEDPLWGPTVTVDHGEGVISVYRGVSATVPQGAHVDVGNVIGKLAAIPSEAHLGPHLHLELYHQGTAVDPASLLGELLPAPVA